MLRFDWDDAKNRENKRKHRVSFEEAETVFLDDWGVLIEDEEEGEQRFVLVGTSAALRVLVVSHTYRARDPSHSDHFSEASEPLGAHGLRKEMEAMKKNYDFSKGKRNLYAKRLKKQITIRLDEATLAYFKRLADETEVPYQTLINLFLRDCARAKKRPAMRWEAA
jgi:uncharacterized DUF497 family protein/predicted DNA binding CopG/RHH family protein